MRHRLNLIVTILLVLCCACSSQRKQVEFDNSIIWEVRKTKKSEPSYILGTVHVMDTAKLIFPIKEFEKLFDDCTILCVEVISDETNVKEFAKKMMLTNSEQNLVNSLDSCYYRRLLKILNSSKRELKYFNDEKILKIIRPAMLAFMIESEKQLNSVLFEEMNFFPEKHFETYAKERNYKIEQLETSQEQVSWVTMENFTFEESMEVLKKTIDNFSKDIDIFLDYQKQNLKSLEPEVYADSIMILRNNGMANGIEKLLKENKRVFVMIGAAHLPYETGVLNLLSQKGFHVKPYVVNLSKKD
jgi:uncharacterized protein YbaP (TraB family)